MAKTLDSRYDNVGFPYALIYNNGSSTATYYYITNLQGDVMCLVDSNGNQVAAYTYDPYGKVLSSSGAMAEINPLRYCGYYQDDETGFYYVSSRYYDPEVCRFINTDSLVSTGQGILGCNMFSYCLNNPVNFVDKSGKNAEAVQWWTSTMWWLCGADTVLPVGDIIYGAGILILGVYALIVVDEVTTPQISLEEEKEEAEPEPPDVTYPGDDPTKAPEGTEWKGKGEQGSNQGNYHNPETGESWHPDLDHPEPIGPHWDYRDPFGTWWRIGPGNIISLK